MAPTNLKGNLTTTANQSTLEWNFDSLLESFSTNGPAGQSDATYTFDVLGRRVSKQLHGEFATVMIHSQQQRVWEIDLGDQSTTSWIHGTYIDEPIMIAQQSSLKFPFQNSQYSVSSLTDETGAAIEFYGYTQYGKQSVFDSTGSAKSGPAVSVGFTGQIFDSESGLLCFRARMYDPNLGRFCSPDPIGFIDGANLYAGYFVPTGTDPLGLDFGQTHGGGPGPLWKSKYCNQTYIRRQFTPPSWLKNIGGFVGSPFSKIDGRFFGHKKTCTGCCKDGSAAKYLSFSLGLKITLGVISFNYENPFFKLTGGFFVDASAEGSVSYAFDSCSGKEYGGGCFLLELEGGLRGDVELKKGLRGGGGMRGGLGAKVGVCLSCSNGECDVTLNLCVYARYRFTVFAYIRGRKWEWIYQNSVETCAKQKL